MHNNDNDHSPALRQGQQPGLFDGSSDISTDGDSARTMRHLLEEFIGHYLITQHLIGSSTLVAREGVLVRVLSNAFVLREENTESYLSCDYFSLKFFRALPYGSRPGYTAVESSIPYRPLRTNHR